MLKEQHIPRSVGKVSNIAAQEIGVPFHSQYFSIDLSPFFSAVTPLCQLHQHFMSSFCAKILVSKKLQSQTETREKLCKTLSYKKGTCKMLMKLSPFSQFHQHFMSSS